MGKKDKKKIKTEEEKDNQTPTDGNSTADDADISKVADTTMNDDVDSDEPAVKKMKIEDDDLEVKPKKRNASFRRVISENIKVDSRLKDNSYLGKKGARHEEYGHQAAKDLLKV